MKTHPKNGPIIPGTTQTLRELEAPIDGGRMFVGGSGWLGFQCACGFIVSARTPTAIQTALDAHLDPTVCAFTADKAVREDPEALDT